MTLGTRGKPGMTTHNFYLPTDIAFAPNGELVVTRRLWQCPDHALFR